MTVASRDTRPRAVIVGGSLSGLKAALGLARAGLRVTVLERSGPAPRSGAALGGGEDRIERLFGPDGLAGAAAVAAVAGHRTRLQTWEETHDLLRRAAAADPLIELVHHAQVRSVDQDSNGAWAVTADGSLHHGDLLIGADGHRSVVRRHVVPEHPDASFAGYVIWLGIADEAELSLPGPWPEGLDILDAGTDTLLAYPMDPPAPEARTGRRLGWAWFDPRRNDLLRTTGCVEGDVVQHSLRPQDVPEDLLQQLDAEAEQWSQPWRDVVRACIRRRSVTGTPIAEYVPTRLARGRVALVGDAAHASTPMTGRGFAVSLDDAEVLTDELGSADNRGIKVALQGYERRSLRPARELVVSGQRFSRFFAG